MNPPTNITPESVSNSINLWTPVLLALAAAIGVIWGKIQAVIAQQSKHSDQIHSIALATPPPNGAPAAVPTQAPIPTPADPVSSGLGVKTGVLGVLLALAILGLGFGGCASDGSLTPQGQKGVATALQIAQIALNNYATIAAAQSSGGKLTNTQVATLASNDLSGLAALAQANVGSTPAAANIASGAANQAVGQAVVAALPPVPITQSTVNTLYSAAAQANTP